MGKRKSIRRIEKRLVRGDEPIEVWTERQLEKLAAGLMEVRSAVFSDAGTDRIGEAHRRISDETDRINAIRDRLHEINSRVIGPEIEGAVMNSDDDPRAIDWPEKQVERLDKRIDTVEEEMAGSDRALDAHNLRISAVENALTAYGIPFGAKRGTIGCFPPIEDEPGPSADGTEKVFAGVDPSAKPWVNRETITGVQAMGREQYERGLSAGAAKAIEDAERRVRVLLRGMGWGTANAPAVKKVINAIRGPKHDTPTMADENEPEPCTCSACVSERTP